MRQLIRDAGERDKAAIAADGRVPSAADMTGGFAFGVAHEDVRVVQAITARLHPRCERHITPVAAGRRVRARHHGFVATQADAHANRPPGSPLHRVHVGVIAVHVSACHGTEGSGGKEDMAPVFGDRRVAPHPDDCRCRVAAIAKHDGKGTFEDDIAAVAADAGVTRVTSDLAASRAFQRDVQASAIEHIHIAHIVDICLSEA